MDDLRNEIRAAFEREQAAHPPAANLRYTVVRSATTRRLRENNLQWLAVAAAVVIGVLVVVSLVASRLSRSGPVNSHPPTVGQHGVPPAGVNLIFVAPLSADGTIDAYDWSGKAQGELKLTPQVGGLSMSPDGQEFISGFGAKGGYVEFFDRLGHSLGSVTTPGAYGTIWADDNRSVCFITQDVKTYASTLWLETPASARAVAQVAGGAGLDQSALGVAACSVKNDTAVLVRSTIAWPTELWVVRLSDGRVLAHHSYVPQTLAWIVATPDAKYVAETSFASNGTGPSYPQNHPPADHMVIRRVSDWTQVVQLDPAYAALKFSGDDSSLLVRTAITSQGANFAIFKWSSDGTVQTVWQLVTPGKTVAAFAGEPDGASIAVAVVDVDASTNSSTWCAPGLIGCAVPLDVTIVHGDGSTAHIPGSYNTTW